MGTRAYLLLAAGFLVALIGAPWWYTQEQLQRCRNFRVVTPDVLYRCGQFNKQGLAKLLHDYGIRTVISLRDRDGVADEPDWEQEFCYRNGAVFVRIPMRDWRGAQDAAAPAEETIREFNEVLSRPGQYPRPVLLHCLAGQHRTGALTAIYRMQFEGWSNAEALAEMRAHGYTDVEEDVGVFLWSFRPRTLQPPWVSERMESGYFRNGKFISKGQ